MKEETTHRPETGPDECSNCSIHGSDLNGDWRGYCLNCALYEYQFSRGLGYANGQPYTAQDWLQRHDLDVKMVIDGISAYIDDPPKR